MRLLLLTLLALLATGCQSATNRPVRGLAVRASIAAFSVEPPHALLVSLGTEDATVAQEATDGSTGRGFAALVPLALLGATVDLPLPDRAPLVVSEPDGEQVVDPGAGPLDLGLPVVVDLGAGEAPFDDGTSPLHPGGEGRGGFSDTVLSLRYTQPLSAGLSLIGTAALSREQDLTIFESLPEARFAFAVVGLGASF